MNARLHFIAAENLIVSSNRKLGDGSNDLFPPESRKRLIQEAQVHAMLAQVALEAERLVVAGDLTVPDSDAWSKALSGGAS